ncbi:MAG: hypothetical protein ACJ79A_02155 [Gemmatimonadaceae bacterium]
MGSFRTLLVWLALLCDAFSLSAQPGSKDPGSKETYAWMIRTEHATANLLAVGDSVDIVLLRLRCNGYGCWRANTVSVVPRWLIGAPEVARARPLAKGSWMFGPGTAGARIVALRPGRTVVTATLPTGETTSDSIWVISAPGAVRVLVEPKPPEIVAGDTVRFRLTVRDTADRIVAILRLPPGLNVVGPPDSLGFTPVAFSPYETRGKLIARLNRLTDTLEFHFVARRKP